MSVNLLKLYNEMYPAQKRDSTESSFSGFMLYIGTRSDINAFDILIQSLNIMNNGLRLFVYIVKTEIEGKQNLKYIEALQQLFNNTSLTLLDYFDFLEGRVSFETLDNITNWFLVHIDKDSLCFKRFKQEIYKDPFLKYIVMRSDLEILKFYM